MANRVLTESHPSYFNQTKNRNLVEDLKCAREGLSPIIDDIILKNLLSEDEHNYLSVAQTTSILFAIQILEEINCNCKIKKLVNILPNTDVVVSKATVQQMSHNSAGRGVVVTDELLQELLELHQRMGIVISKLSYEIAANMAVDDLDAAGESLDNLIDSKVPRDYDGEATDEDEDNASTTKPTLPPKESAGGQIKPALRNDEDLPSFEPDKTDAGSNTEDFLTPGAGWAPTPKSDGKEKVPPTKPKVRTNAPEKNHGESGKSTARRKSSISINEKISFTPRNGKESESEDSSNGISLCIRIKCYNSDDSSCENEEEGKGQSCNGPVKIKINGGGGNCADNVVLVKTCSDTCKCADVIESHESVTLHGKPQKLTKVEESIEDEPTDVRRCKSNNACKMNITLDISNIGRSKINYSSSDVVTNECVCKTPPMSRKNVCTTTKDKTLDNNVGDNAGEDRRRRRRSKRTPRLCPSMEFDVKTTETKLRQDGIEHPDREVQTQLTELGVDNLLRACRPAKCCRRSILNERQRSALPYACSLRSLPLVPKDVEIIKESLEMSLQNNKNNSQKPTEAEVVNYCVDLAKDDIKSSTNFPWVVPLFQIKPDDHKFYRCRKSIGRESQKFLIQSRKTYCIKRTQNHFQEKRSRRLTFDKSKNHFKVCFKHDTDAIATSRNNSNVTVTHRIRQTRETEVVLLPKESGLVRKNRKSPTLERAGHYFSNVTGVKSVSNSRGDDFGYCNTKLPASMKEMFTSVKKLKHLKESGDHVLKYSNRLMEQYFGKTPQKQVEDAQDPEETSKSIKIVKEATPGGFTSESEWHQSNDFYTASKMSTFAGRRKRLKKSGNSTGIPHKENLNILTDIINMNDDRNFYQEYSTMFFNIFKKKNRNKTTEKPIQDVTPLETESRRIQEPIIVQHFANVSSPENLLLTPKHKEPLLEPERRSRILSLMRDLTSADMFKSSSISDFERQTSVFQLTESGKPIMNKQLSKFENEPPEIINAKWAPLLISEISLPKPKKAETPACSKCSTGKIPKHREKSGKKKCKSIEINIAGATSSKSKRCLEVCEIFRNKEFADESNQEDSRKKKCKEPIRITGGEDLQIVIENNKVAFMKKREAREKQKTGEDEQKSGQKQSHRHRRHK